MTTMSPASANLATIALSNIRHAVILVAADGRVIFANSDAEALFSMSSSTLGRSRLQDLVPFGPIIGAPTDSARSITL